MHARMHVHACLRACVHTGTPSSRLAVWLHFDQNRTHRLNWARALGLACAQLCEPLRRFAWRAQRGGVTPQRNSAAAPLIDGKGAAGVAGAEDSGADTASLRASSVAARAKLARQFAFTAEGRVRTEQGERISVTCFWELFDDIAENRHRMHDSPDAPADWGGTEPAAWLVRVRVRVRVRVKGVGVGEGEGEG